MLQISLISSKPGFTPFPQLSLAFFPWALLTPAQRSFSTLRQVFLICHHQICRVIHDQTRLGVINLMNLSVSSFFPYTESTEDSNTWAPLQIVPTRKLLTSSAEPPNESVTDISINSNALKKNPPSLTLPHRSLCPVSAGGQLRSIMNSWEGSLVILWHLSAQSVSG